MDCFGIWTLLESDGQMSVDSQECGYTKAQFPEPITNPKKKYKYVMIDLFLSDHYDSSQESRQFSQTKETRQ